MKNYKYKDTNFKLKVKKNFWWMNSTTRAMVIFGNVYYQLRDEGDDLRIETIVHEYIHIKQILKYGSFGFYLEYLYQLMTHGYYDAPFEAEARSETIRLIYKEQFYTDINQLLEEINPEAKRFVKWK